ncbi:MAG: HAD family hydrolase [Synergistaceae bacterium]|jgi:phosphoglycolate phosphatase-like HAD superfamily hydrolase|nr:HAD family hydrolase [Synergistaceae bacterium]
MTGINPDCLIFDVDGVLLRSNETYQEIIRMLVEGEWRKIGLEADAPGYSGELNFVFKNHGSFNDDYDIAWTLLNIAASSGARKLSEALPSPKRLEEIVSDCAGTCGEWLPKRFGLKFGVEKIRKLGQDIFTGDNGGQGLWKLDRPMLDAHWSILPHPVYIYTGRNLREWRFAQETLGWQDFPDERAVHAGTGIRKPSPEGLAVICSRFGHERPVFFGDTRSDKLSFDAFGRGWFAAIGDMLPESEPRFSDVTAALSQILGWESRTAAAAAL